MILIITLFEEGKYPVLFLTLSQKKIIVIFNHTLTRMGFEREINKPGYSTGQDVRPERIDQFRRGHHGVALSQILWVSWSGRDRRL